MDSMPLFHGFKPLKCANCKGIGSKSSESEIFFKGEILQYIFRIEKNDTQLIKELTNS